MSKNKIINIKKISEYAYIAGIIFLIVGGLFDILDSYISPRAIVFLSLSLVSFIYYLIFNYKKILIFFKTKKGRRGLESSFNILLVFILILTVYLIFLFNFVSFKIDFTKDKLYSLTDKSIKVVNRINKEYKDNIIIYAFDSSFQGKMYEILKEYSRSSKKIIVKNIDAEKDPSLAKSFKVRTAGSLVFTSKDKPNIILTQEDMMHKTMNQFGKPRTEYLFEEKLTSALYTFIETKKRKIYFLKGHGEKDIENYEADGISKVSELLKSENINSASLNLIKDKMIPKDAEAIVIVGPESKISPFEINKIVDFVKNKCGSLLLMSDPIVDAGITGLEKIAKTFDITLDNDIIMDFKNFFPYTQIDKQIIGGYFYPFADYDYHQIVNDLSDKNLVSVFLSARSISFNPKHPDNYVYNTVINTSKYSYGETDIKKSPKFNKGIDKKGPLCMMSVLEIRTNKLKSSSGDSRLVIFGDSDLIQNRFILFPGHKDLFVNSIQWLLNNERSITIRAKKLKYEELYFSKPKQMFMLVLFIGVLPLLIFGIGIAIFIIRKHNPVDKDD